MSHEIVIFNEITHYYLFIKQETEVLYYLKDYIAQITASSTILQESLFTSIGQS